MTAKSKTKVDPPPRAKDGDCLAEWLGVLMKINEIAAIKDKIIAEEMACEEQE